MIDLSQMFGKIRGGCRPIRNFFDFHNKTLLALAFFKIEENYQQQSSCPCKYAQLLFVIHFPKIKPFKVGVDIRREFYDFITIKPF